MPVEHDPEGFSADYEDAVCSPPQTDDFAESGEVPVAKVEVGVGVGVDSQTAVGPRGHVETPPPVLRRSMRLQAARRRRSSSSSTGRFVSTRVTRANVKAGRASLCTLAIA